VPLLAVLLLLLVVPLAGADPADDYRAIHRDWEQDGQITPCYWTLAQLENAREIANDNPDDSYNGFPDEVDVEIARWRRGECDSRARIASVKPKRERVRIANEGPRAVEVGGMRLRDRQRNSIRLRRGMRIEPGASIVVRSGRRPIWDDRGDVARLVARDGAVVSQLGYGRYRGVKRF
jgi:hypothetical protein